MAKNISSKVVDLGSLEWVKVKDVPSWRALQSEMAKGKVGEVYLRKINTNFVYYTTSEGKDENYACFNCDETVMGAKVAHPVHDGPFKGSGSGRCEYETVPYCPTCEDEPSFDGTAINPFNEPSLLRTSPHSAHQLA